MASKSASDSRVQWINVTSEPGFASARRRIVPSPSPRPPGHDPSPFRAIDHCSWMSESGPDRACRSQRRDHVGWRFGGEQPLPRGDVGPGRTTTTEQSAAMRPQDASSWDSLVASHQSARWWSPPPRPSNREEWRHGRRRPRSATRRHPRCPVPLRGVGQLAMGVDEPGHHDGMRGVDQLGVTPECPSRPRRSGRPR